MHFVLQDQAGYESGHGQQMNLTYWKENTINKKGCRLHVCICRTCVVLYVAAIKLMKCEAWGKHWRFQISWVQCGLFLCTTYENMGIFFQRLMEVYYRMSHPGWWLSDFGLGVQTGWWMWRCARGCPGQGLGEEAQPQVQGVCSSSHTAGLKTVTGPSMNLSAEDLHLNVLIIRFPQKEEDRRVLFSNPNFRKLLFFLKKISIHGSKSEIQGKFPGNHEV